MLKEPVRVRGPTRTNEKMALPRRLYDGVGVVQPAYQHRGHGGVGLGGPFGERAHRHVTHSGRLVDGAAVLLARAVPPAHVPVLGLGRRALRLHEPPEQLSVEVLAERAADQVERDRVDARVAVAQAEADDAQHVPERVVLLLGPRVVVEPQHEHVVGQEAHGEHQHERQHRLGHLLPGTHLTHLALRARNTNTGNVSPCRAIETRRST